MTTPRANWKLPTLGITAVGAAVALPLILGAGDVASAQPGHLKNFSSCSDLKAFAREASIRQMRNRPPVYALSDTVATAGSSPEVTRQSIAPAPEAGGDAYSTTNVQIAGIDEPDIVKTDGSTVYAIADGHLYAVDTTGQTPRVVGSLDVGMGAAEMLITDGTLIVIGSGYSAYASTGGPAEDLGTMPAGVPPIGRTPDATTLTRVDISDPTAMRVVERLGTDADYVSARMADGTIRIVLRTSKTPVPMNVGSVSDIFADAAYLNQLDKEPAEAWLPSYHVDRADGAETSALPLTSCEGVSRTVGADTGTSTITVLTIDPAAGLEPIDRDTIMGDGWQVMMSEQSLYVTTTTWGNDTSGNERTAIHAFDITDPRRAEYRASGSVDGSLLNQFSMDEHDGVLRVATTRSGNAGGITGIVDGPIATGDNAVTTLRPEGDRLATMGEVAGLGKGERIYSVRFIGDRGYVVTFRQTDPLYTIDLSDVSHPRVVGELKIPGYSAYLHPVGEHLVLGVGQDASDEGRRIGTQVSLFDTSDPANPRQVDKWSAPGTGTAAEWNHHAFLWWAPKQMAVLPISSGWGPSGATAHAPAIALHVTPNGIDGTRELDAAPGAPRGDALRSMVIGGKLLTLTELGLTARSVDTLDGVTWTPFR